MTSPIIHSYSRRSKDSDPNLLPTSSSEDPASIVLHDSSSSLPSDPVSSTLDPSLDLPIALQKSKCWCTYLLSSFVFYITYLLPLNPLLPP